MRTLKQVLTDLEKASFMHTITSLDTTVFEGRFGCEVIVCKYDNVIRFSGDAFFEMELVELFLEYLKIWGEGER